MATGKSCSRWFAAMAALLMVVSLSGCFDKEGDQRKAFIDFLQNTAMRSGERLPTLTADQKKQFGPFVSDYAVIYGYSQQVSQAMDAGLRPVVDSVNAIRVPQDYMTQREPLRQANGALGVLSQQLQNAKMQADAAHGALKQADDLKLGLRSGLRQGGDGASRRAAAADPGRADLYPAAGSGWGFCRSAGDAGELCRQRHSVPDLPAGQSVQCADWAAGGAASGV